LNLYYLAVRQPRRGFLALRVSLLSAGQANIQVWESLAGISDGGFRRPLACAMLFSMSTSRFIGALSPRLWVLAMLLPLTRPTLVAQGPALQGAAGQNSAGQSSVGQSPAGEHPTAASSTTPAVQPPSGSVKEVNLLAFVHDKKEHPVANLGKQDFVLEQDGRAQAITQLANENSLPLTVGVLADTGAEQRKALAGERKASTEFFNRLLRDEDRGFVLHFDKTVELLQDVTSSHDKLAKGIEAISAGEEAPRGSGRGGGESEPNHRRFSFGGEVLYDAIYLAADEVLKGQVGRKAIVLFSDGVDRSSKTTLQHAIEAAQRADVLVYCVYVAPQREAEEDRQAGGYPGGYPGGGYPGGGYPGGGYPRYPGGGYPGGYPGGGPFPGGGRRREPENVPREVKGQGKKTLQQIADETGGRFFELSKKLSAAEIYTQIEDEMRHQYSLSYTPDTAASGYHKLHVSTRNPELTVRTRSGFYAE
jgi:hypothetical protein